MNIKVTEENHYALSIGDVMTGLLAIMILVIMGFILLLKDTYKSLEYQQTIKKNIIIPKLEEAFKAKNYEVVIDKDTGVLILKENILFAKDSYQLTKESKDILKDLIPTYSKVVFSNYSVKNEIANIVIEGHTSRERKDDSAYLYNLDLSLKRAQSIANFIFSGEFDSLPYLNDLRTKISVVGRSYSDLRIKNDPANSLNRRVEFKIRFKDHLILNDIKK